MHDEILRLHALLNDVVLEAGVGPKGWAHIANPTEHKAPAVLACLQDMEPLCNEVTRIKSQFCATPEMWENMEALFSEVGFPEVGKLERALKAIKTKWREHRHGTATEQETATGTENNDGANKVLTSESLDC